MYLRRITRETCIIFHFRGDCDKILGRHNRFSVNIREVILNETLHWKYPDEGKKYYNTDHVNIFLIKKNILKKKNIWNTVKLCYNDHGYNDFTPITTKI